MRVGEEVLDAGVAQEFIDAFAIAALGEPDALRPPAEMPLEFAGTEFDLNARGIDLRHQRQESVRRAACDKFEPAGFQEATKAGEQIVAVLIDEDLARAAEHLHV